jgi:hypothetical protein
VGKLSVDLGYYYLGVKNMIEKDELNNIYSIKTKKLTNEDLIGGGYSSWHLKSNKILKMYTSL